MFYGVIVRDLKDIDIDSENESSNGMIFKNINKAQSVKSWRNDFVGCNVEFLVNIK